MDELIKYPVVIDNENYTVTIKDCYVERRFHYKHYKLKLYKGKYKIFKRSEYISYFEKRNCDNYQYNLIQLVKDFVENYQEYKKDTIRKNQAIEDLKEWDGIIK